MFIILDRKDSAFSRSLEDTARGMGINTLYLTEKEIVHDLTIDYRLTDQNNRFTICFRDHTISSENIYAVYCGLDYFKSTLWPYFTDIDATYAAQETFALWLALLTTLSCRMLNPPALDALSGHMLSVPETLSAARDHGFTIPLSIILESGSSASALLAAHSPLQFANLGQACPQEFVIHWADAKPSIDTDNHCRITEILSGRVVHIALIGERFFASSREANIPSSPLNIMIPQNIKTSLRGMHNHLELNMAEYQFRIRPGGEWVFSGYSRVPGNAMVAYGDTFMKYIVNYAIGNAGS